MVCYWSGRCLDADARTVEENGCRLQLWDYQGTPNQQWRLHLVHPDAPAYVLVNRASGKCLDAVAGSEDRDGCPVQLWDYLAGANQRWVVARA